MPGADDNSNNDDKNNQDDAANQDDKNQDDSKLTEEEKQAAADKVVDEELDKDLDLKKPAAKKDSEEDSDKDKKDGEKSDKKDSEEEDDGDSEEEDDDQEDDEEEDDDEEAEDPAKLFVEAVDAKGKKHKIYTDDDLKGFEFEDALHQRKVFKQLDALEAKREELKQAGVKKEAEKSIVEDAQKRLVGWDGEIEDMVKEGVFDKPKKGNEAYTLVDSIFKFMIAENKDRAAKGRGQIESFRDGHDLFQLRKDKDDRSDDDKKEQEDAKRKGGKVAGAKPGSKKDSFVYKPGQYNSIDDVPV